MPQRIPRHFILSGLAYLLVALCLCLSVLPVLSTRFLGAAGSDVYEMAHHIWWFKTALQNGDNVFWHSLLGYPDGFAVVQLWANPLQFFPAWLFAFVMPLPMAFNVTILLTLTLNGWAMYALARRRLPKGHHIPAWMAGLVFMVFPIFQGHLYAGHLGLLMQWPLPLLLLCLFDYADGGGRRGFLWSLLFFLLALMGHTLQIIYALTPLMVLFALARLYRRDYAAVARVASVGLLGVGLLLLFLSPIFTETVQNSQYTEVGGYVRYSIDLLGLISPSFANPFWGDIAGHSRAALGENLVEGSSYIGLLGGLLAFIGLFNRREARWWLVVAFVAWLLALGPLLKVFDQPLVVSVVGYDVALPLPYALAVNLPLLGLARTPGRFMFLFAPALAMMVGYGMAALWSSRVIARRNRYLRYGFALVTALLVYADYQFFGEFPTVSSDIPQAIHDLKTRNDIRAIYNAPYHHHAAAKEALYLQTAHGKPLIAGQDTRQTPVDPAKLELLASFQPPLLDEAGADIVIINKIYAGETLIRRARRQLGGPFYEDGRYALFENPISNTPLDDVYSVRLDEQVSYIYKSQPGWLAYRATLQAENRRVHLLLDGARLQTQIINGETEVLVPLPIARAGYHTFRMALDPPCPERIDTAALMCRDVSIVDAELEALSNGPIYDPIRIEGGIELAAYHMPTQFTEAFPIRFWWRFADERSANDVRFIHVLDENRRLVTQDDTSFGQVQASSERAETVMLNLRGLPPGEYRVLAGWYALPDAIRYDVLTNVEGSQDNTIALGTIRVGE